nr:ferritin-like domain-containing protein [Neobacillus sp. Marseille-Q6967]
MYYYNNPYQLPVTYDYYDAWWRNGGQFQELLSSILNGIKGEAAAIDFYTRLVKDAPDNKHREDIQHALDDEKIHLKEFTQLYKSLSGQDPKYQIKKTKYNTYEDGLRIAYGDELEAYEDYRNSFLLTQNMAVRDIFFRAMTDEIEHATRFGFLLMGLNKR